MKKISLLLILLSVFAFTHAQDEDHLVKDLKCYDETAFNAIDLLISTRSAGEYEPIAEWSEKVSSEKMGKKIFQLEGGIQYVIVLTTDANVDGTAIEIRNGMGEKLEYTTTVGSLNKNEINFFYTPPYDDAYQISFRAVNSHKPTTCMYMGIFKGEPDPQEQ